MLGLGLGLSKSPGPLGDPAPFITEWRTDTNGETITIPIVTSNTYTYTTSDDQSGTTNGGSTTITFPTAGTHEVSISGDIQRIQFNNTGDKLKIYDIKQWGTDTTWTSFSSAFYGCNQLNVTATDTPSIFSVTSMTSAFRGTDLTTFNNINNWDVSNVTRIDSMFRDSNFNRGIGNWNVSSVTNIASMFRDSLFNQDISNWNVGNVNYMGSMFAGSLFNQDIGNWDVSNVISMAGMFQTNTVFDQDISSWDITSATNFANFLESGELSTSNYDALLIGWEAALQLEYPNGVDYTPTINIHFGNSQYTAGGAAELARISLQNNYNWAITDGGIGAYTPDVFVTEWETTTANETLTIPLTQSSTYTITTSEGDSAINFTGTNPTVTFPTAGTHQVIINGDVKQIKFNNTGDREKILDVKQWGTDTTWTSFSGAFYGCSYLNITASDAPNLSSVTSMTNAFRASNLITFNNVNNWDVSSITQMRAMFDATPFNQNIGNWNVSSVTDMSFMFRGSTFNQDIGSWNVSNVTTMRTMFNSLSFNQDISNWDIINVTDFTNFLSGGTLSTSNYDALLIGWEATLQGTYQNGANYGATISINFGNSKYTSGGTAEAARDSLETTFGWNITDGGIGAFASNVFVTEWRTTTPGETLTIPMVTSNTYDVLVLSDTYNEIEAIPNQTGSTTTSAITNAGTYLIGIIGDAQQIQFNNTGDKGKIYDIKQWGTDTTWTSFSGAFYGCSELNITASDAPNLSSVTTMQNAFRDTDLTTFNNVNNWDVSNVRSLQGALRDTNFNQSIGSWNVSNVTNVVSMFYNSSDFNQDIGNWDVSNVANMSFMFSNTPFNQNIGGWDVSNVTEMREMFSGATTFNQDIGNWDVSNVTDMIAMFRGTPFNQDIGNWNVSSVTTMGSMFRASNFNQDIGNWDVSSVTNMGSMFYESPFNQNLANWDVTAVNNFLNFMYGATLSTTNYDALLIGWAAQNVISNRTIHFGNSQYSAGGTAEAAKNTLTTTYNWTITDGGIGAFADNVFVTEWQTATANETLTIPMVTSNTYDVVVLSDTYNQVLLNQTGSTTTAAIPTAGTYQVGIIGNAQQIQFNDTGDKLKIYDVKQWGTDITWVSFDSAFRGCSNLNVTANDAPNLSSVTTMINSFRDTNLTTFNNVNNWDVSSVTNMLRMFESTSFNQDIGNWDVSNVTSMTSMFASSSFNQNISNWDVGNVASMRSMFNSSSFNQDIGDWDVSNVTRMDYMFYSSPFNQDIGNWDVSNVTNMSFMFAYTPFNQNIGNWDVSSVLYMSFMFNNNSSFNQDIGNWNVTNVTSFTNLLFGGTLSTSNYDALLIGWAAQNVISNRTVSFGNSQYTAGGAAEAAKNTLTTTYGWTITDGGIGAFASNVFVTEWQTATSGETLTIPMDTSNTYDVVVISDNNAHEQILLNQTGSTTTASIPDSGTYQVGVIGNAQQIRFNNGGDKLKIYDVKQWGTDIAWTSFSGAFYGCNQINVTATDAPNLSLVTTMLDAFRDTDLTTFNNVNNWDVSNVTNMQSMFNSSSFNQDIGDWDVSNVTQMNSLFNGATSFNQDIGNWDVSNVEKMPRMFNGATSFDQNIGDWNVINVTSFTNLLFGGTLSTSNYDALLNGWYSTLKAIYVDPASPPSYPGDGLNIHFGNSVSSSAGSASRTALTQSPFNWTITDGTP